MYSVSGVHIIAVPVLLSVSYQLEVDPNSDTIQFHSRKKCHIAFVKMRFTDVTSHYPNSWVFLVFRPKVPISGIEVQPLVIPNIKTKQNASYIFYVCLGKFPV